MKPALFSVLCEIKEKTGEFYRLFDCGDAMGYLGADNLLIALKVYICIVCSVSERGGG